MTVPTVHVRTTVVTTLARADGDPHRGCPAQGLAKQINMTYNPLSSYLPGLVLCDRGSVHFSVQILELAVLCIALFYSWANRQYVHSTTPGV